MSKIIKSFQDLHNQIDNIVVPADIHKSYDLTRIKKALDKLGNPQDNYQVVHVAGTSGKTSTSYYVSEILRRGGYKVGLSVSPHIEEVNERVQINLEPLGEGEFVNNLSEYLEILDKNKIKLTYFELFVSFGFWYFAKAKVDVAVFEVGLGGLLDGTNVVNRPDKVCVITDIDLDHTSILGKTIEEITAQKAGIIKDGNNVFCINQSEKVIKIIKRTCQDKKAKLKIVSPSETLGNLPYLQQRNWQLARTVCEHIFTQDARDFISEHELDKSTKISIPGRIEKLELGDKTIILDGAHNAQKMKGLVKSLEPELGGGKVTIVLSVGKNKSDQLLEMAQALEHIAGKIIITSFDEKQDFDRKSLDPEYLAEYFPDHDVEKEDNLYLAIQDALGYKNKLILITGSLYLVGRAKKMLPDFIDQ
ncbi:hypothetical protein HZB74_00265 [Candidatus Saccharibacteria bacterium]|nr:hypothetical protein [Candidatus Saccharibacteria bacterium]